MPDVKPLDLTAWLPEYLRDTWHRHPRGASIRTVVPDGPAAVAADPEWFGQVIDFVIDNACRYGATLAPVTVTVARRGSDIVVTVVNEGVNIPEAERGRVFQQPGRGLTLAAYIVRSLGGKIAALPQKGGARIAILLPAAGA
jgi:signal transduction histidine kinase